MIPTSSIGILDSGIGGLTVFREIARRMPFENLIYLADTAHLPYGEKSSQSLAEYTQKNLCFLSEFNIKLCVIACHTLSTHFPSHLSLSIPCLTLIPSTFRLLSSVMPVQRLAILGTTQTLKSQVYEQWLRTHYPQVEIHALACPLLAPFVEGPVRCPSRARALTEQALSDLLPLSIDAALLACTHYPFLKAAIQDVLGNQSFLLNPAPFFAKEIQIWLKEHDLLNPCFQSPEYRFFSTKEPCEKNFPDFFLPLDQKQEIMKYT